MRHSAEPSRCIDRRTDTAGPPALQRPQLSPNETLDLAVLLRRARSARRNRGRHQSGGVAADGGEPGQPVRRLRIKPPGWAGWGRSKLFDHPLSRNDPDMPSNAQIPDYDLEDLRVVSSPQELRAMADPLRNTILDLLLERSATVAELASAVDRPKSTVAYHVGILMGAGMLKVVRTRRVRAIDERSYGRTARIFYVGIIRPEQARALANYLSVAAAESGRRTRPMTCGPSSATPGSPASVPRSSGHASSSSPTSSCSCRAPARRSTGSSRACTPPSTPPSRTHESRGAW